MMREASGPPAQWIQQESTPVVSNGGKNLKNNVSIQTGEEFSMEFLQDRAGVKGISVVPDTSQNLNLNHQLPYDDLTRILGLGRKDSECASAIPESKGSPMGFENGSYVDKSKRFPMEDGEDGPGIRNAFCKLNGDRIGGFGPNVPSLYGSEFPRSKQINGPGPPGVSDGSQSWKIKFLCSVGGKILPRPSDGKLRYVGGETRIISIRKNLSWQELVRKTLEICNEPHSIKYQLPGEDLDALISVSSDEDLQNMIEEYHGLERLGGSQRLRIFLIPLGDSENSSSGEASNIQQSDPDYQYVIALNGIKDSSPHKNSSGQCLTSETSLLRNNLDNNPSFCKHPQLLSPLEIGVGFNALHPSKGFNETRSPYPFPVSPAPFQHGDSPSIHAQRYGGSSSIESNGSFISVQLNSENSGKEAAFPKHGHVLPDLLNHNLPHNKIDCSQQDQHSGVKFNHNEIDFSGFSNERHLHKETTIPTEEPISRLADPLRSSDSVDSHPGMSRVYSDTRLQEEGGGSGHCSQDGLSPLSPMNFSKGQSPSVFSSSALREKSMPLRDNTDSINSSAQNKFLDIKSSGSKIMPQMLYSQTPDQAGRKEPGRKGPDGDIGKYQGAKVDASQAHFIKPNYYGEKISVSDLRSRSNESDPILHPLGKLYEGNSLVTGVECKNVMVNGDCNHNPSSTDGTLEKDVAAGWSNVPTSSANDFKCSIKHNMERGQNLDRTRSDLLMDRRPVSDKHFASKDRGNDVQDTSWSRNSEVAGFFSNTHLDSGDESSVANNVSESSNGPVLQPYASRQATYRKDQINFSSRAVLGASAPTSNHANDRCTMFQDPTSNATLYREFSLMDHDFVNYNDQNMENLGFGGSAYNESNLKDKSNQRRPSTKSKNRSQLDSATALEDPTDRLFSGIQAASAVVPCIDMTSNDMTSLNAMESERVTNATETEHVSKATESESIITESELPDATADDRGKDESFSDAMIAEMEASIYGLQIIKNVDLEELRELGSGTYGTVFHGKWRGTDVAIKRIKKSCFAGRSSEQERLTKDFWREAQILSNLHHPNVVAFYGVVPDGTGGTLATVTEFMVNGSLRNVLIKKNRSLDRRRKLMIAMDAAFGMEYLHSKNIVHFDLKCDNLLVNLRDPQRPICKVGDFGLSRIKRNTLVSGGVRGTLPWMAPELLNGSSNGVSEKVDVFSFGISLWEILTGEEPYADMHCGAIIGGILKNTLRPPIPERCDPEWRKLMEHCWSPDPDSRPSFTEITKRLRTMSLALQPKKQNT